VCNLDCTYCFFLFKEMLYPGSKFWMADDLLELYLSQLLGAHAESSPFAIDVEGEHHRPGPARCSAVHIGNGVGIVAATAGAPVHDSQYPRAGTGPGRTRSASRSPRARSEARFGGLRVLSAVLRSGTVARWIVPVSHRQ
jgi:hypothetical protein